LSARETGRACFRVLWAKVTITTGIDTASSLSFSSDRGRNLDPTPSPPTVELGKMMEAPALREIGETNALKPVTPGS